MTPSVRFVPAHVSGYPAKVVDQIDDSLADHVANHRRLQWTPISRDNPACRWCGFPERGHTLEHLHNDVYALWCDELALRLAWGDR